MLNSFIIVLREGFESFLLVAIILSFLKKTGHKWLTPSVYVAIILALATSAGLGYLLKTGVDDYRLIDTFGTTLGGSISQFFNNEALREAILGVVAMIMVASLVIYMWRSGPTVQQRMRDRLTKVSSRKSRVAALAGVFLFTFLMITREGMETALLLLQVRDGQVITGALLGIAAAGAFALAWARFGHTINVKRFFQVTGIFLLLFMIQVGIYSFHEFAEAGLLPNSELLHEATEKLSPDGLYGKWFSVVMIAVCGLWLFVGWLVDRLQSTSRRSTTPLAEAGH
jgi:high-affinity iron transporter